MDECKPLLMGRWSGKAPGECLHTLRWDSGVITAVSYSLCARQGGC